MVRVILKSKNEDGDYALQELYRTMKTVTTLGGVVINGRVSIDEYTHNGEYCLEWKQTDFTHYTTKNKRFEKVFLKSTYKNLGMYNINADTVEVIFEYD